MKTPYATYDDNPKIVMTVLETVKKYRLENTDKHYVDQDGKNRDTTIPLDKLMNVKVLKVDLYPEVDKAIITIDYMHA